jgi:hypothetical protein
MGMGALIGGGASLLGGLLAGGGAPTAQSLAPPPNYYSPYAGQAATNAFQGIQGLPGQQTGQQFAPLAQQTGLNLYNNPYAQEFQQGAGTAGQLGQQAGLNQFGAGSLLAGGGAGLVGAAPQLLQMGFDPQGAFYKQAAGQLQDRTLANLANAGIGTTPYGQSVAGNVMGNFDLNWQNQALQRALMGAQGAGGALQQGGGALGAGTGLQAQVPGTFMTGAGLPYATYGQIGQGQLGGLGGAQGVIGGGQQLSQLPIQDYMNFLSGGQAAANNAANFGLQQNALGWNQAMQQNQATGQGLGMLASGLFGKSGAFPMSPGWGSGALSSIGSLFG